MSFTSFNRLLSCVAEHYKACLMGPRPSSLHGRKVGCGGFEVQLSFRGAGHLGPIREEMEGKERGWEGKRGPKTRRQMGRKNKGECGTK